MENEIDYPRLIQEINEDIDGLRTILFEIKDWDNKAQWHTDRAEFWKDQCINSILYQTEQLELELINATKDYDKNVPPETREPQYIRPEPIEADDGSILDMPF